MTYHLVRPVRSDEVEMVYHWRNHPRVRAVMPFSGRIDLANHREWWPMALADPQRRMLVVEDDGLPVAMVVLLNVQPGRSTSWGFYTAPQEAITPAKAMAAWMACERAGLVYAFDHVGVERLHCQVHEANRILAWRERVGFVRTGSDGPFIQFAMSREMYQSVRRLPRLPHRAPVTIEPDPRDVAPVRRDADPRALIACG